MRTFFIIVFCSIQFVLISQDNLIINTYNRKTISLNGKWKFIPEPTNGNLNKYQIQQNKNDLIENDWEHAAELIVPGDYNSQKEYLLFYENPLWYAKEINYIKTPGKRIFIYFGAINYKSSVYINSILVAKHTGGFTPFNVEITNQLKDGKNYITIKTDNRREDHAIPTTNYDWWNYGGITRDVMLIELPETYIQDYHIQLNKDDNRLITGWVRLNGKDSIQEVTISIPEAGVQQKFNVSNGYGMFNIPVRELNYWSPENPKLFDVSIQCKTDNLKDKIGFRSIQVKGSEILLNGKAIFLKGICMHDEYPLRPGRIRNAEEAKKMLLWAKELGCNFIRLAHYPHNEYTIKLADEMGFLLWEEIPVYWQIQFANDSTYANAKNQLSEMINRDRNRASVIFWSVANETNPGIDRQLFLTSLIKHTKDIDPTRLVSAALKKAKVSSDSIRQYCNDPLIEYTDVMSLNEYIGWYPKEGLTGMPGDCKRAIWDLQKEKPIIISEFGAEAFQGFKGDTNTRWSEEFQSIFYSNTLKMLEKITNIRGMTPWILTDYKSPNRKNFTYQNYWNRKGLISNKGKKKKAFYILKAYYQNK